MSILDNEGHDPQGFGNALRRTDASDLARLEAENRRLRMALDAILTLDANHDLPDAWKIAGDALRASSQ